jgi:membrane protease YdiL (CAAX protease family)
MAATAPATASAPIPYRPQPWGVLASIGFALVSFFIRGPILRYAPLHALVQASHRNFLAFSALVLAIQTASVLVIVLAVRLKRWPLAEYLSFAKPRAKDVALGIAVVLAWYLAQNGYYHFAFGKGFGLASYRAVLAAGTSPWWYLVQVWPSLICAPIVEESTYRGFLWRGVESRMGGTAAFIITSICFTAAHFPYFIEPRNGTIHFDTLAVYAVTALIFGWLRWRSGGVAVSMVAHAFSNVTIAVAPVLITAF